MDHYDLLVRPDWKAESILVVSPYVERTFFKRILEDLRPTTLTVVIDDGCRSEDVAMLRSLVHTGTEIIVVLGSAPGLVHAKIFHVQWLTTGGNQANTLVYGSGNATRQAFAGNFNSEMMCKARLTAANHASILAWMQRVRTVASDPNRDNPFVGQLQDAWLADGVYIRLPSLKIKATFIKPRNLDLWIQRGRLLSRFQPDTGFLQVNVNLLKSLPAEILVRRIQSVGFKVPMRNSLSIPYIETIGDDSHGDALSGNWLSHYFIWTQLGYWCSDACFLMESSRFKRKGHEKRLENLELLKRLENVEARRHSLSDFLARIAELWTILGDRASDYLESRDGQVDQKAYQGLFEKRLERDFELLEDTEFRHRYVNGCEVIGVPRFRTDAIGWRSFVDSFMRQIHFEWLKAKSQSGIYNSILNALSKEDDRVFEDPKKIGKLLRSVWNKEIEDDDGEEVTVGEYIDRYQERP